MKLGIMANCYIDKTWEEACAAVKNAGLKTIEVSAGGFPGKTHCNPGILLKDKDKLSKFVKSVKINDLEISALDCHGNPLHPQKKFADRHILDLKEAIELAPKIGVRVINCFAGCPGSAEDAKYPNWITYPWPDYFGKSIKWQWEVKVIPFWKEMAKLAKKVGVKLGFEMHSSDIVYNPELLLKLKEEVGAEEISCNLDPSHLFWQGINPIKSIQCLKDTIVHVHAKDTRIDKSVVEFRGVNDWKDFSEIPKRAWTFRTVGYGHGLEFWKDFVYTLRLVGYDEVVSIEHEDPLMSRDEGLNKAIDFLNRIILYEKPGEMWWLDYK